MEKLELKHLAPYLPYGLEFYVEHLDGTPLPSWTLTIDSNIRQILKFQNKPILRPLSDLTTKYISDFGFEDWEIDLDWIKKQPINEHPYGIIINLFENHFDVFGLIKKGLAIDINTL